MTTFKKLQEKINNAFISDPEILVTRDEINDTLGVDAKYLHEILDITKSDLLRLEKLGFVIKARYATENRTNKGKIGVTGPHRIRYIILKEVLDAS